MKLNEFNIEKTMLDYQSHKFGEMKEIVNETIKENKTLNNTIDIQKIKIDELENINDKLSRALNDAEQRIDKANNEIKELLYLSSKTSTIYKNDIEVVGIYDRLKNLSSILKGMEE